MALKYAKKEKNYKVAGASSLELFSRIYFTKKDTTAFKYLEEAKKYYELGDYKHGLVEIDQMTAYIKFLDDEYEKCNDLILQKLDSYKQIEDDAYYYLFATYMLVSNYIYLEDFDKAHYYHKAFKTTLNNPTTVFYNYNSFQASIDVNFAEVFFQRKQLDSLGHYLAKSSKLQKYMGEKARSNYYKLYADFYSYSGDLNTSKAYLDSLKIYKDKMFRNVIDSSIEINDILLQTESELEEESDKKYLNGILVGVLLFCLLVISVLYLIFYRKQKVKISNLSSRESSFSYLKTNHEKLKVKVRGLEGYIDEVKKEVKTISTIDAVDEQRDKIKELYKNVRLNSSTVLSKNESQLELINDLNIDFFTQISEKYPQLNESEIIICYYLFTKFKSKEIALFLGTTTRAIESKRYRIRKKLNIRERNMTMFEFFNKEFQ
ncbi:hypothetical protein VOI54_16150 [Tamlana sp. 2201CG12-4]|uniref:hypothetical protein n=1 Tax=Tamlana sp. 2201CG12-4 TaxID=3112582 RepID=UPI002DB805E5|nr:hypothetical protein [Tamlana sp. 2201CG12-4]MEC3908564.1 hypothetical protein [Tamlana sp. 2201CG12-4]